MATKTKGYLAEIKRDADHILRNLLAYAEEMPEWVEYWENSDELYFEQYVAETEWRNDVMAMDGLEQLYEDGEMTAEQEEKYRKLKKMLKNRLNLIEDLELTPVPVPLD